MAMTRRLLCAAAAALALAGGQALAAYPDKPVRIVVPYAPGALNDILTRTLAQELSRRFGSPVVVVNRPGAREGALAQLRTRYS